MKFLHSFLSTAGLITIFNFGIYPCSAEIVNFSREQVLYPNLDTVVQLRQANIKEGLTREQVPGLNEQIYGNNFDMTEPVHHLNEQVHNDNFDLIAIIVGSGCVAIRLLLMLETFNIAIELNKTQNN